MNLPTPAPLRASAPTRLTLALDVVRRLTEGPLAGFHELAVVKHQIDLADTIEVRASDQTAIRCADPRVPRDQTNICWKAVELLRRECGVEGHAAVGIDKRIPVMGGLAGGSADAAATLMLLNRLWGLGLGRPTLCALGRRLGMDVPYFFTGATALDSETTDALTAVPTDLAFDFVLVVPRFGMSTREAYAGLDHAATGRSRHLTEAMVEALKAGDRDTVIRTVHNDFENSVFARHPVLEGIRDRLVGAGCETAFMSGSGSTIVGIAPDAMSAGRAAAGLARDADILEVLRARTLPPGAMTLNPP